MGARRGVTEDYFANRGAYGPNVLWRIARMGISHKWHFGGALVVTLIGAFFFLLIPKLLGQGVDQAFTLFQEGTHDQGAVRSLLVRSALLIVAVSALRGVFAFIRMFLGEWLGQRVAADLRMIYFDKLQALSFSFHDNVHTGNLMSRGLSDIEGVRMFVQMGLIQSVYVVVLVGTAAFFMISLNLQLALMSLSFVPFIVFRSAWLRMQLRRIWREIQETLGEQATAMQENLAGVRVVRAFSAQKHEEAKFDGPAQEGLRLRIKAVNIHSRGAGMMTFSFLLAWALIIWFGGTRVIDGNMTVGELTQFLLYMSLLQMPVRMMTMVVNSVARAHSAGGRVFEVIDEESAIVDAEDATPLKTDQAVVRFEDVSFGYGKEPALQHISFEAAPGHTIGIVGAPGSGKSTIAHLVARYYDVTGGQVTIDGTDVRKTTLKSVRQAVGLVQQDPFLFDGSMGDNIRYGNLDATQARVETAARTAQIHSFIESLPDGYDTEMGERGVTVSGGQRQRIVIARTLLLDPPVLIFDDATSSVDAGTDRRIREELAAASRGRTTIIIAHRLSSLEHADEILVLDRGLIVERGTHRELLRLDGWYKEIHDLQQRPAMDGGSDGRASGIAVTQKLSHVPGSAGD